jgi:hypothetical protein
VIKKERGNVRQRERQLHRERVCGGDRNRERERERGVKDTDREKER